jgi:hypothetical protein
MYFSPLPCFFVPLRPKCLPQRCNLQNSHPNAISAF